MEGKYNINSLTDAAQLADKFASKIKLGDVLCFSGNLGAGKTTLIQLITKNFQVPEYVNSPTFTIINEYSGNVGRICHMDFYRINSVEELYEIGIEEYFNMETICMIEWAEKFPEVLPLNRYDISIVLKKDDTRIMEIKHV